jgi:uncharacterized membrane protein
MFGLITVAGYISAHAAGGIFKLIEIRISRIPLIGLVYTALRDLVSAFTGDKKRFNTPVLVKFSPDSLTNIPGFLSRQDMSFAGLEDSLAVYIPDSYNFAGRLVIVPKNQITFVKVKASEWMAFIVSAGVTGPGTER